MCDVMNVKQVLRNGEDVKWQGDNLKDMANHSKDEV